MTRHPQVLALLAAILSPVMAAQTTVAPVLRTQARIVVLDVGVTDGQGNPVRGLHAADFALAENGQPQAITHFEAHNSLSPAEIAQLPTIPKMDPNIFTNLSPVPANGALTVLLLDSVNTPMKDQSAVRAAMLKYLDAPHPGTQIAIFSLGEQLRIVQGFTMDTEVLRAAIGDMKNAPPQPSRYLNDAVNGDNAPPPEMTPSSSRRPRPQAAAMEQTTKFEERVDDTLTEMNALARYLGAMPGRKNLLWISGSFAVSANMQRLSDELRETTALFARNHVAVYPVDARGLLAPPAMGRRGMTGFLAKTDVEHTDMMQLADDTGGRSFLDTNDLAGAIGQVVDDGANFYTLTYSPANREWKGEFRKLKVALAQSGCKLSYRPGYYAVDGEKPEAKHPAPVAAAPPDPMLLAMEHAMPAATDILFKAAINPATGKPETAVARGNVMSAQVTGPYKRYVIALVAVPAEFTFTRSSPGHVHLNAQMSTRVYTPDGQLLNVAASNFSAEMDDAHYQTILHDGLQLKQEISVPVKGTSFLRIGVQDIATGRVGSVELPATSLATLKPLPATFAAPCTSTPDAKTPCAGGR